MGRHDAVSCCLPQGPASLPTCPRHWPSITAFPQARPAHQPGPPEVDLDHQLLARVLGHEQVAAQRHAGVACIVERSRRVGVVEARAQGAVAEEAAVGLGRACAASEPRSAGEREARAAASGPLQGAASCSKRLTGGWDGRLRGRWWARRGPRWCWGRQAGPGGGGQLAHKGLLRAAVLSLPAECAVRGAHVEVHLRQLRRGVVPCSRRKRQEVAPLRLALCICSLALS